MNKQLAMKITAADGMVNLDCKDEIAYSNIANMYTTGDGCGVQLSERLEPKRDQILSFCNVIADKIYELQDIIKTQPIPKIQR